MGLRLTFGEHTVEVGNEDKVFFPEAGITKGDLVRYYARIADTMLPTIEGRPVSMKRYPDGIGGGSFFQKEAPGHFPDWIERATVRKKGGTVTHVVVRRAADLVYLAGQACITPHVWLSRIEEIHRPDRMIFDLDPSVEDLGVIRAAARAVREVLEEIRLVPFLMTSGSRGYHLWVPLDGGEAFPAVRRFARGVARVVVARDPDSFTIEARKAKRGDRVLIDYFRNGYAQTAVPPYGVRARPGAPVATPLGWEELGRIAPRDVTIRTIFRRLGRKDDPWKGMARRTRSLAAPRRRLERLGG